MNYNSKILDMISPINSILAKFQKPELTKNSDFVVDKLSNEELLIVRLTKSNNTIPFSIYITPFEGQINIDRIHEAYEWSYEDFKLNYNDIAFFFEMLLTYRIRVKYYGKDLTKIYFIDSENKFAKKITVISGMCIHFWSSVKESPTLYINLQ